MIESITQTNIKKIFNNNEEDIKNAVKIAIEQFAEKKVNKNVTGDDEGTSKWFEILNSEKYKEIKFPLKKIINIVVYNKNSTLEKEVYKNLYPKMAEAMLEKWCPSDYEFKFFDDANKQIGKQKMTQNEYIDLLEARNQIILQGPPGTGKTRLAKIMAINIINKEKAKIEENAEDNEIKEAFKNLDNAQLIQFHPSYSYEDFVRGIVAKSNADNKIEYKTENKILAQMAEEACRDENKDEKYILIIDEINRANLSSVLGELIYALEYRDEAVQSMYDIDGNKDITLPKNLYIIGTMNTADRSIGHIDYAIRRRFAFVDVPPNKDIVSSGSKFEEVQTLFKNKDDSRASTLSPEFNPNDVMLGHSYFIEKDATQLEKKLKYQVIPLLKEYIKDGVLINSEEIQKKIKKLLLDEKAVVDYSTNNNDSK